MNLLRLMIWKEFAHIRADRVSVVLMTGPVFVMTFLLGYALTTEVKNITVAAVDESRTPESLSLIETVRSNPLFRWKGVLPSAAEARHRIDAGSVKAALVVPPDFSQDLARSEGARVQLLVDGQDANSANVSRGYINAIVQRWAMQRFGRDLEKRGVRLASLVPVTVSPVI
ncbi:MAG: ABC transporter permease, partial [Chitinispirillaceae bacterium]|nr:ABC transporter permease [Chitinispirillaceae bacterium]